MRKIRIFSIIVFITAIAVFGIYRKYEKKIADKVEPEITMDEGEITVSCEDGEDVLLQGIKAQDDRDGDVTDSLLVESISNFMKKNKRKVTIVAFDDANNASKVTRIIKYKDYKSPRFSLEEPLKFPVNTQDIMGSLSVKDVLDGEITDRIKMSSEYYVRADEPGNYPMVFTVSNSAGDVEKLLVTIQIYDPSKELQSPRFELSEYLIYIKEGTEINPWDYLESVTIGNCTFEKNEDGNFYDLNPMANQKRTVITQDEIQITQNVDVNKAGVYEVVYQMTDTSGKETLIGEIRLVVVVKK